MKVNPNPLADLRHEEPLRYPRHPVLPGVGPAGEARLPAGRARVKPTAGGCCVFCSRGGAPGPPVQAAQRASASRARGLAQHVLAAYPALDEFEKRLSLALYRELAARLADGTLAVQVEAVYPIRKLKEAVAHAARGGRSGKILVSFGEV